MSEQELLLLSNYAYFRCSVNEGTIGENIKALKKEDGTFDMEKVVAQGATGDIITDADAIDILTRLEADEKLSSLELKEFINDGDMRVALYADETGKDATMIFRGTGGTYDAWEDNVLGAMESDTAIQKRAADFVKNECKEYKNITVAGHSKGGNLSQYVTVTCSDQIERCVSFDGQGFGTDFIGKYSEEISQVSDRITCINGYNDFVNILLTPIAGTYLYVHNVGTYGVTMHSCYTILSKGIFDNNGDFDRVNGVRMPAIEMIMAKGIVDSLMNKIDGLPDYMREDAIKLLGTYVAALLSGNMSDEYEKQRVEDALKEVEESMEHMKAEKMTLYNENKYINSFLYINLEKVKACYYQLQKEYDEMKIYPVILEDILVNLDINVRGISFTEIAIKKIISKLDKNLEMLYDLKNKLLDIIIYYEKADSVA